VCFCVPLCEYQHLRRSRMVLRRLNCVRVAVLAIGNDIHHLGASALWDKVFGMIRVWYWVFVAILCMSKFPASLQSDVANCVGTQSSISNLS